LKFLNQSLFCLLSDIQSRPRKSFRAELVQLGFALSGPSMDEQVVTACGNILEDLHTGSLIIDDIEDNSKVRRGDACLHHKYGLPLALNAGNFLYFQALKNVQSLPVSGAIQLKIQNQMIDVLCEAHKGQSLDLKLVADELDRSDLIAASREILTGKSGALTSLALQMGGIVFENDVARSALRLFGYRFGECLQRFDDIGNLQIDQPTQKHLEDLENRRLTYLWSFVAQNCSDLTLVRFQDWSKKSDPLKMKLPLLKELLQQEDLLERAQQATMVDLQESLVQLKHSLSLDENHLGFQQLLQLSERLTNAYQQSDSKKSRRDRQWIWGASNSHPPTGSGLSSPNL
jgi:geranylgeranyl pyrophosphate synthase